MLPDYPEALERALRTPASVPPDAARRRLLTHALGCRLAEPLLADRDQPPFDRVTMDGYALRASDVVLPATRLKVVAALPAGVEARASVGPGETARVGTGAPLPPGADCVVRHEWTDRAEPVVTIRPPGPVRPGACVHRRAADARAGDVLARADDAITPVVVGAAAAVGVERALVVGRPARPSVMVLTSGDEVVPPATPTERLTPAQIRSSNEPMLGACVRAFGGELVGVRHVRDDAKATLDAVRAALADADVLVTVGGVSAGERDFFPGAFGTLGVEIELEGAAIQPGRPIVVGRDPVGGCVVVALPGNPVSALVCAHLFLWPILRSLAGQSAGLPWKNVSLAAPIAPNPQRHLFRPVSLDASDRATAPAWAGSGDLMHALRTDGIVEVAPSTETAPAGTVVQFLPWAWECKP